MSRGLLQGKPTSPLLFCLLLDFALKDVVAKWQGRGPRAGRVSCTHVCFMDDILLFASSIRHAEEMVQDIAEALQAIGLRLNPDKT
eukprot:1321694-Amphidinium_carterae.1